MHCRRANVEMLCHKHNTRFFKNDEKTAAV
jgi:hypothetical protein